MLAMLSGCGFKPLYGGDSASHTPRVAAQFASIEIPPIGERVGQQMRNKLIDSLHSNGPAAEYKYRLNVTVVATEVSLGLQQNSISTRGQERITARYFLIDNATGKTLLTETLRASAGYDILVNQFGSLLSAEDARDRGLEQIAEDMTEHLALYFMDSK